MYRQIFSFAVLLSHTTFSAQASHIYCSANNYGSPTLTKCYSTLSNILSDPSFRYFVEQQLRTSPQGDWLPFVDRRPASQKESIAQLPKWWSDDNCNVALVSYGHQQQYSGLSLMRWLDVYNMATQVAKNCLFDNQQGGAGVLFTAGGEPALTLYIWADGAPFDSVMPTYMSSDYPKGLDPANLPSVLGSNFSSAVDLTNVGATSLVRGMVLGGSA